MRVAVILFCLTLVACGKHQKKLLTNPNPEDVVVKSRAEFVVTTNSDGKILFASTSQPVPVTVTNAPATSMTLDTASFVPPTITNGVMNFGTISVATLLDNDLRVCGAGLNQKCNNALLRVFTQGVPGAGLFNLAENYGVPITATLGSPLSVGLNAAGAAVMQSFVIPAAKRVMRLTDFTPTPTYQFNVDFTDAGSGSFTTTIVIEYALTL